MEFCSIASGSSGNCIFVATDKASVLIDAGISKKRIEQGLAQIDHSPKDLDAILITHEHTDHIQGLKVFLHSYELPVYCTAGTMKELKEKHLTDEIDEALLHVIVPDQSFSISDLSILPFHVSHDAADPVAFHFQSEAKKIAVVTDLGYYDDYTVDHLKNLDAVMVESNHDINMLQVGKYPYYLKQRILGLKGHLSNDSAGRLISEILHDKMQRIVLGHLSKENNYEPLAKETVASEIARADNPYKGNDFPITIASRYEPTELITV